MEFSDVRSTSVHSNEHAWAFNNVMPYIKSKRALDSENRNTVLGKPCKKPSALAPKGLGTAWRGVIMGLRADVKNFAGVDQARTVPV
jgi:hypothetical protein